MSNRSLLLGWRQRRNRNLFQFLSRRVRAAVDIEDLAQETYLRLLPGVRVRTDANGSHIVSADDTTPAGE